MLHLPTNKFIKLNNPQGGYLDPSGVLRIQQYLANIPNLDAVRMWNTIGMEWTVSGTADYTGTMPKRIANYLWRNFRHSLDAAQRESLGQLCKQYVGESYDMYVSFTQKFNWEDGEFGDEDSCLWYDNGAALRLMEYYGFFAMKRHSNAIATYVKNPKEHHFNLHGVGRAWVVVGNGLNGIPNNSAIVFNGYNTAPDSCTDATLDFARYLADYSNLYYKKVRFLINGERANIIHINHGRFNGGEEYYARGFLVSTIDIINNVNHTDIVNYRSV